MDLTSSLDLLEGEHDSDDYTKLSHYLECVQNVVDVKIDINLIVNQDVVTDKMIDNLLKKVVQYAPHHLDKKVFFHDRSINEHSNMFLSLDSQEASNYEVPNRFYIFERLYHPTKIMVCNDSFFDFYFYAPFKNLKYRPLLHTRADWDTFLIVALVLIVIMHSLLIVSVVTSSVSTWYIFTIHNNFEKSCPGVSTSDIENETYKDTTIMQAAFALMVIEIAFCIVVFVVILKTSTKCAAIFGMIMMYLVLIPIIMDIFIIVYLFSPHTNEINDELNKIINRYIEMDSAGAKSACSASNAPSVEQCYEHISTTYLWHVKKTKIPSIVCLFLTIVAYLSFFIFLILMRKKVVIKILRRY